jgi:Holliday junction resolvasome RuvABC endonuclease subunit
MIIPVVGFDPSLTHWGIAEANLDLMGGYLNDPVLSVLEPEKLTHKQVRQNSTDLFVAEQLAKAALAAARRAKVVFVECPVGSQSARAMASYGVCVGILGSIRAEGIQLIEVTATEVKKAATGNKNATKQEMIDWGVDLYPEANWPVYGQNGKNFKKGDIHSRAEHVADGLAAIHAGVMTPTFQNLMRLYER